MATWIALLRGINVGGKNVLPMAALRLELEEIGLKNVRTYIQSGNVIFESSVRSGNQLADSIAECIEAQHGFRPPVFVLTRKQLEDSVAKNPFPDAAAEPKSLQFFFLERTPKAPDKPAIAAIAAKSESWHLAKSVFYLHAPDGLGRSKLGAKAEKLLAVNTTARNLRTVEKLLDLSRPTS